MLKDRIQEDMKATMRARDSQRLGVIRLLMAAIKQKEIDERISLNDAQILAVINKMVRQRRDSVEQFAKANRNDLVDIENFEIQVLQEYLPEPLSGAEVETIITEAIKETDAASIKDMGKVMALVKPKIQGRADMGQISAKIKNLLQA